MSVFAPRFSGFYGKLPARGDFVRAGLPGDAVDALDGWARLSLAESRHALGDEWRDCWMEAPVWRFRLAPGRAGAAALIGLLLLSIDSVGRCFPLIIACGADTILLGQGSGWLDAAEALGFQAVTADLPPDALAAGLAAIRAEPRALPASASPGLWWTDGAPRLAARQIVTEGLPDPAAFAAMLADPAPVSTR
jgi:type VI secretion system protein ImpM